MHIVFLNPQGNFDKNDSYWTMHPDFGGQLVYVKEIASEMANMGHKVDIITRQIIDPEFPEFSEPFDSYANTSNLRIIRIPCGGPKFLNKELLWEHLYEWTNNIIDFYEKEGQLFDFMTSHYADGGLAAVMIKEKTDIPFSFTGHSLGAQKFDKLNGSLENYDELDKKYNFTKRIIAERSAMEYADIIFVSTIQEKEEQYTHIMYCSKTNDLHPLINVAPPGANTKVFAPCMGDNIDGKTKEKINNTIIRDIEASRRKLPFIILASRLDPKKNHLGLLKAYAKNLEVQSRLNLLISLRGIDNAFIDYNSSSSEEKIILDEMMKIIKESNLTGKVTFISINSQIELADTYRYLSKLKSVFVLTALYEPFGLAPIEAMSAGLPVVVTKYGGPSDVLQEGNKKFGVLVDVLDIDDIGKGILKLINNYDYYKAQGTARVLDKYTWETTAKKYIEGINNVLANYHKQEIIIDRYFTNSSKYTIDSKHIKKLISK
ncbi:MAG: glycosyltransferase [Candidatus Izimaplasma sp.]|nr:glycosyltransferase [Candidatus Izimaplasma bacterium]